MICVFNNKSLFKKLSLSDSIKKLFTRKGIYLKKYIYKNEVVYNKLEIDVNNFKIYESISYSLRNYSQLVTIVYNLFRLFSRHSWKGINSKTSSMREEPCLTNRLLLEIRRVKREPMFRKTTLYLRIKRLCRNCSVHNKIKTTCPLDIISKILFPKEN